MNDSVFSDSFVFQTLEFHHHRYRDYRSRGAEMHYFGCMKTGWARLTDGTTEITVYPGQLFYIPKGCRYQSFWYSEDRGQFLSLGFHTYPSSPSRVYRLQKIEMTEEESLVLRKLSENMAVSSLSVGLLYTLLGLAESHMATEMVDRHNAIVEDATLYMNRCHRVSAQSMAEHCGVSVSTLYHAFRKATGKTPNQIWHQVQAQKAVELLVTTDIPIEEISLRLGFSSSSYFRKIFTAQTGKTPREVRRSGTFFSPPPR